MKTIAFVILHVFTAGRAASLRGISLDETADRTQHHLRAERSFTLTAPLPTTQRQLAAVLEDTRSANVAQLEDDAAIAYKTGYLQLNSFPSTQSCSGSPQQIFLGLGQCIPATSGMNGTASMMYKKAVVSSSSISLKEVFYYDFHCQDVVSSRVYSVHFNQCFRPKSSSTFSIAGVVNNIPSFDQVGAVSRLYSSTVECESNVGAYYVVFTPANVCLLAEITTSSSRLFLPYVMVSVVPASSGDSAGHSLQYISYPVGATTCSSTEGSAPMTTTTTTTTTWEYLPSCRASNYVIASVALTSSTNGGRALSPSPTLAPVVSPASPTEFPTQLPTTSPVFGTGVNSGNLVYTYFTGTSCSGPLTDRYATAIGVCIYQGNSEKGSFMYTNYQAGAGTVTLSSYEDTQCTVPSTTSLPRTVDVSGSSCEIYGSGSGTVMYETISPQNYSSGVMTSYYSTLQDCLGQLNAMYVTFESSGVCISYSSTYSLVVNSCSGLLTSQISYGNSDCQSPQKYQSYDPILICNAVANSYPVVYVTTNCANGF